MDFNSSVEKLIFYKFPIILFICIPLFLITGPFLSDLSVSLIALLFMIFCVKKKNFSYFKNKYFYFFLVFWIYLILNTLINNFNVDSLKISFFYFRYGIFVISIVALLSVDNKFIRYFFYSILISFIILILDGFYQYFNNENIFGMTSGSKSRISSFFQDEWILGSYLSRLWPLFFGLSVIIFKNKNKLFSFLILIFILSEVLIFLSGDRTAFFYINLSTIFVIILSQKLLKLRLFILLSSIFLILIITFINPIAKERIIDQSIKQMNLNNDEEKYIFSHHHHHIYLSAYKMFLDNKIIGVGVKNFRKFCSDKKYYKNKLSCDSHPHNTYLQILVETGIIGFLFLLTILIYFLKHTLRHLISRLNNKTYFNDFEICLMSGIAIYLWPFAPTGNVFNNWINILLVLYIPFLINNRGYIKT